MDNIFLKQAIKMSEESIQMDGYPIGALVVKDGNIIGVGKSLGKTLHDATLHAEVDAIRNASKTLQNKFLDGCTLYSSCEPCRMCFSASVWARIPKIVYTLKKDLLPDNFFESKETIEDLNSNTKKKRELIYISELEEDAKKIVDTWSSQNK